MLEAKKLSSKVSLIDLKFLTLKKNYHLCRFSSKITFLYLDSAKINLKNVEKLHATTYILNASNN